jgi:uncharacterized protein (DUF608 family)
MDRRGFLRSTGILGAVAIATKLPSVASGAASSGDQNKNDPTSIGAVEIKGLDQVAFPMGGIGAGMVCLEGVGGLTHASFRNRPFMDNELGAFAAISIKSPEKIARVVEGPVPNWRRYLRPGAAKGTAKPGLGLPRFEQCSFEARFPFGEVKLDDSNLPISAKIVGWSPFEPGDEDNASLPVAGLEYTFTNKSEHALDAVFSYNVPNSIAGSSKGKREIRQTQHGIIFYGGPDPENDQEEAWVCVSSNDPDLKINYAWFRGSWFDGITMVWNDVEAGAAYDRALPQTGSAPEGATLFFPITLSAGASKTIRLTLSWYAPNTHMTAGASRESKAGFYRPWYSAHFDGIGAVNAYWVGNYDKLRAATARFSQSLYDTSLPREVIEAVAANLCILKSPTVLRQTDGRFYGWEGCDDRTGLGHGTCTHVWNYAQAVAHLFPSLERSLRETEFTFGQDERGHQNFRVPLPIQPASHDFHAAVDGQFGGIIKTYREWRISGDTEWLKHWWPKVKASLDFGIETWDPAHKGWAEEPHHNTYDIEFWGPDGLGSSFYLAALKAAVAMGKALNEDIDEYQDLLNKGTALVNDALFNGEYFMQRVEWKNLRAKNPAQSKSLDFYSTGGYSPEAVALMEKEGPKYQYGPGCLSDGVLGAWLALACGVGQVLDPQKVKSHLHSVHRYNLKADLFDHANPQRPNYALGHESGLLLCSWPKGGKPALPFVYSDEVWTGIEYQAACHMILMGLVEQGLEVVRSCRSRYDGIKRNPFDEYEWGNWYARAMASYGLLQAMSGARYDAVDQVLYLSPRVKGDFRCFLSTASGYGTVGVKNDKPFFDVVAGKVEIKRIDYTPNSTVGV